jgi:hypothetical protein
VSAPDIVDTPLIISGAGIKQGLNVVVVLSLMKACLEVAHEGNVSLA